MTVSTSQNDFELFVCGSAKFHENKTNRGEKSSGTTRSFVCCLSLLALVILHPVSWHYNLRTRITGYSVKQKITQLFRYPPDETLFIAGPLRSNFVCFCTILYFISARHKSCVALCLFLRFHALGNWFPIDLCPELKVRREVQVRATHATWKSRVRSAELMRNKYRKTNYVEKLLIKLLVVNNPKMKPYSNTKY